MAKKRQNIISESVGGKPIPVNATLLANAAPLHEICEGDVDMDEVFLYAANSDDADAKEISIYHEDSEGTQTLVTRVDVPAKQGQILLAPGLIYNQGGKLIAIAGEAGKITISGWVNQYDFGTEDRNLAL